MQRFSLCLTLSGLLAVLILTGCGSPTPPADPTLPPGETATPLPAEDPDYPPTTGPAPVPLVVGETFAVEEGVVVRPTPDEPDGPFLAGARLVVEEALVLHGSLIGAAPGPIPLTIRYRASEDRAAPEGALKFGLSGLGQAQMYRTEAAPEQDRANPVYVLRVFRPQSVVRLSFEATPEVDQSPFVTAMADVLRDQNSDAAPQAGLALVAQNMLDAEEPLLEQMLPRLVQIQGTVDGQQMTLFPPMEAEAPTLPPSDGYRIYLPAEPTDRVNLTFRGEQVHFTAWLDRVLVDQPRAAPLYIELRLPSHYGGGKALAALTGPDGVATFRHDAEPRPRSLELLNEMRKPFMLVSPVSGATSTGALYLRTGRDIENALEMNRFALPDLPEVVDHERIPDFVRRDLMSLYNPDIDRFMTREQPPQFLELSWPQIAVLRASNFREPAIKRLVRDRREDLPERRALWRAKALEQYGQMKNRAGDVWTEADATWLIRGLAVDDATSPDYTATMFLMLEDFASRLDRDLRPSVPTNGEFQHQSQALGARAASVLALTTGAGLFRDARHDAKKYLRLAQRQGDEILGDLLNKHVDALHREGPDAPIRQHEQYLLAAEPLALTAVALDELHQETERERYAQAAEYLREQLATVFVRRHGELPIGWEIELAGLYVPGLVAYRH